LIGNCVKFIYQKIKNTKKCFIYKNIGHFKDKFSELTNNKSIFLIKGSNAIGLNKLINKCYITSFLISLPISLFLMSLNILHLEPEFQYLLL
jgi:hypothetical protein